MGNHFFLIEKCKRNSSFVNRHSIFNIWKTARKKASTGPNRISRLIFQPRESLIPNLSRKGSVESNGPPIPKPYLRIAMTMKNAVGNANNNPSDVSQIDL